MIKKRGTFIFTFFSYLHICGFTFFPEGIFIDGIILFSVVYLTAGWDTIFRLGEGIGNSQDKGKESKAVHGNYGMVSLKRFLQMVPLWISWKLFIVVMSSGMLLHG